MADYELERRQVVPRTPEETFEFFSDPRNLEAITPPWLRFRILSAPPFLGEGSLLEYRLQLFGIPVGWRTEITRWRPPRSFVDRQLEGPYRLWVHTHRFAAVDGGTEVYDHVRYRVPGGPLARLAQRLLVADWLEAIFEYRAERLAERLGS